MLYSENLDLNAVAPLGWVPLEPINFWEKRLKFTNILMEKEQKISAETLE